MKSRIKIELELLHAGDGRVFLNFWNYKNGNDVCCQLVNGKLIWEAAANPTQELSISEFIAKVTENFG